ncbi:adenosine kinase [bacterium]|nr:adenosine kinase [bacterium]
MAKGAMTLIDEERAKSIYAAMSTSMECSGGSAANSLAGIAQLGGKAGFIGKVYEDQLGAIFRHDMNSIGVQFSTPAATSGKSTALCMILVTPDAQRTMNTFIGASNLLSVADMDEELIKRAKVLYVEGYLWDDPNTIESLRAAIALAQKHETIVAFTLSDRFCVERHHASFMDLIKSSVDWLFANESELEALTGESDFDAGKNKLREWVHMAAITRSEKGSVLVRGRDEVVIPAITAGPVVDTTGAGDLYASGVLYGLTHGMSLEEAGTLGSKLAGHIITHIGARSQTPLRSLLAA